MASPGRPKGKPGRPKGQPKTGGGSRKGRPNKLTTRTREQLWEYCQTKRVNPFEHAVDVLAGEVDGAELTHILDCAKDLRQYLLPKPKAIEIEFGQETRKVIKATLKAPDANR